ncbi:MAG: NAD(+) synthase [Alphaproteobacteria bacterium]|nr:NAD(+) synthase [Alphaproteobacteria bacterium]
MAQRLRLGIGQFNPRLGAVEANLSRLLTAHLRAREVGCDLLMVSELYLCGYPPEDLILQEGFVAKLAAATRQIQAAVEERGGAILVGLPLVLNQDGPGSAPWPGCVNPPEHQPATRARVVINGAALFAAHQPVQIVAKSSLPNYGVFDEPRIFCPGGLPRPLSLAGRSLGVMICEDMWQPDAAQRLAEAGCDLLLVLNGSPHEYGKGRQRLALARQRVTETGRDLLYVNQWGGQDELVFDGGSFFHPTAGEPMPLAPVFADGLAVFDWSPGHCDSPITLTGAAASPAILADDLGLDYRAIVVGLRDYALKNGFSRLTLGLSGGVDSALVAALAVDAVGAANLGAVMMPSPYTSAASLRDAEEVAARLGVELQTVDILAMMRTMADGLAPHQPTEARDFGTAIAGVTGENLQSRIRGMILMTLSNGDGSLVLTTGNKSELATGYSTLYGDSCGAFAPLRDVYKTRVFALGTGATAILIRRFAASRGRSYPAR